MVMIASGALVDEPPTQPATRLHLFGGPYVTVAGRAHTVPESCKRLLAFLALQERRLPRRHVAGTLWPVGDEERAAGNLRSVLWRLRGVGADLLVTDKSSLVLNRAVEVDVRIVSDWATRMTSGPVSPSDLAVPAGVAEALDLLPGWYEDWALVERERLRQRTLHALDALARRLLRAGRHAEAIEAALLAVGAEPLRESAQRVLIETHLAERNRVEARRSFGIYRNRLRRELGTEPSRELAELVLPRDGDAGRR